MTTPFRTNRTFAAVLLIGGTIPRTPEEIFQLLRAWVNGDSSYFGTVPCLIEQDDGPISTILIEARERSEERRVGKECRL